MSGFTKAELAYLSEHNLARLATATAAGTPHVVPVRFQYDVARNVIGIGSHRLPDGIRPRRYRHNVNDNDQVALVIDDFSDEGPRGITIHGVGRIHAEGGERLNPRFEPIWLAVLPIWVSSWGIDTPSLAPPYSRWITERS